jgi:hypothetical protein
VEFLYRVMRSELYETGTTTIFNDEIQIGNCFLDCTSRPLVSYKLSTFVPTSRMFLSEPKNYLFSSTLQVLCVKVDRER